MASGGLVPRRSPDADAMRLNRAGWASLLLVDIALAVILTAATIWFTWPHAL